MNKDTEDNLKIVNDANASPISKGLAWIGLLFRIGLLGIGIYFCIYLLIEYLK